MENECDSNLLATSEINQIDKNIKDVQKESDEINEKNEQIQGAVQFDTKMLYVFTVKIIFILIRGNC